MRLKAKKQKFWNGRAMSKELAGTNDFMLKEIERREIMRLVKRNSRVLDIGCGDGHILSELASDKNCTGCGIDFAGDMIKLANSNCISDKISFMVYDMRKLSSDLGSFDYILSKRSLCNLDSSDEQKKVFYKIMSLAKKNGYYLMIEDFEEGLEKVNILRKQLGLYEIGMPWHNLFLNEKKVIGWVSKDWLLEKIVPISGTYYFLSRVIYAKLNEGKDLKYDSAINKIAMVLPQDLTDVCVTKLFLWKKIK